MGGVSQQGRCEPLEDVFAMEERSLELHFRLGLAVPSAAVVSAVAPKKVLDLVGRVHVFLAAACLAVVADTLVYGREHERVVLHLEHTQAVHITETYGQSL